MSPFGFSMLLKGWILKILVTGAAGFIGMHCCERLLDRGDQVIGVDNLNDYYDVGLKESRLARLLPNSKFAFHKINIEDRNEMALLFSTKKPDRVIHLAAQAGVRYSMESPHAYISANVLGFMNILEGCRHTSVKHLVYASSSSVYGGNESMPFSEHDNIDHPISLYAATKKANELMAHTYSHNFDLPTTGLRFFTVYGPWGRPDMSPILFASAMTKGESIDIFNNGNMSRDFTYIDDVVEGIVRVLDKPATKNLKYDTCMPDPATAAAPYRVFNVGKGAPTQLMAYVGALEVAFDVEAKKNFLQMQPGDVPATFADTSLLSNWVGYSPDTPLEVGVKNFVRWYRDYYKI